MRRNIAIHGRKRPPLPPRYRCVRWCPPLGGRSRRAAEASPGKCFGCRREPRRRIGCYKLWFWEECKNLFGVFVRKKRWEYGFIELNLNPATTKKNPFIQFEIRYVKRGKQAVYISKWEAIAFTKPSEKHLKTCLVPVGNPGEYLSSPPCRWPGASPAKQDPGQLQANSQHLPGWISHPKEGGEEKID